MTSSKITKPFVKWAGGKRWIIKNLNSIIPPKFNNYHEPFLGGGAVYFHLQPKHNSFLSDINEDLINTYEQIKVNPYDVLKLIDSFKNNESEYYTLRSIESDDNLFNAARFIFINKVCYNGIYRVNSQGKFNVPYGHNEEVNIYDEDSIIANSNILKNTNIQAIDFEDSLEYINQNDLVFLDPPYTVAHRNNGFIAYNQKIFSWEDQERLADCIDKIKSKNAYYILTNAAHISIDKLFSKLGKKIEINRASTITSKIKSRKEISEYIFTNCI